MRRVLTVLFLVALAAAPAVASAQSLSAEEMAAARKTYVGKCAKCHKFYDPKNYSDGDWRKWMESMTRKSRLKPDQAAVLTRYLDAYRAGELPGKPQEQPRKPKN